LPPVRSRLSSIELGVLVDRIEAYFDADRRELENRVAFEDLIGPTGVRTGVQVDPSRILGDITSITRTGSGTISSDPLNGVQVTLISGYRTEPPASTFASFANGRHPVPRRVCRNADATFIVTVTCAREAPVIIVMTPPAYS
jgi:hypothetical protein